MSIMSHALAEKHVNICIKVTNTLKQKFANLLITLHRCTNKVHQQQTTDSEVETLLELTVKTIEPPRDKTNNVVVRPAKTQISLGIRPV